ncbi:MAG: hypothetical protein WEB58_19335 [Planctomycetaceae bacterium]
MATISDITERLRELPPEKLVVVYDFVSYLTARQRGELSGHSANDLAEFMLASEKSFAKDWNSPKEEAAWSDV